MSGRELAKGVRSDQDRVAGMDDAALDDSAHHRSHERHRKGVVDVELEWRSSVVVPVVWQYIQEGSHKVEAFSSHVGHLEDRTYPLTDKLCGGVDSVLAVFNENGDFTRAGRFENAR